MSGTKAAVMIAGIAGVAMITVAAVCNGHDGMVVTGSTAAITGICTGVAGYYQGKSAERKVRDGNTKSDSGS